jgi:hypothetical protein
MTDLIAEFRWRGFLAQPTCEDVAEFGYRKEIVGTIFDSNNRAVFQIFRLRKVSL